MFKTPTEIVELVEQTFKVKTTVSQICYYEPKYGKISADLKTIFDDTRERYLKQIGEIPIANEAYRMEQLQRALDRQLKARVVNEPMVLNILEQAAKERGRMYTNRREITGAGGKDLIPDPVALAKIVLQDVIENGMPAEEAVKFVAERYKVAENDLITEAVN